MKAYIKQLKKEGKTYKQISEITGLTKGTISYHVNDDTMRKVLKGQKIRRAKAKEILVEYKGSKCFICGYNKCNKALEFHHLDPNEKEFVIGHNRSFSIEKLKKEVDKCIMVCSNCHKEIHAGIIQLVE